MRWRLILAFLVVILVTLLSLSFWIQNNTIDVVDNFLRRGGNLGAEQLVDELENHFSIYGNWTLAEEILEGSFNRSGQNMMNSDGQSQAGQMPMGAYQNRPTMYLADKNGNLLFGVTIGNNIEKIEKEFLENSISLKHDGETIGYLIPNDIQNINYLNYAETLGEQIRNAAFNSILIAGAVSIILAFIFSYFLFIPVRQLTTAAENLAQGDFSKKLEISGANEFVTLGETFNYLAESLQSTEKRRQAMTADIAHELRTPLAVQRANLEAMQDGVYPMNQENISMLINQNEMLNKMVEDLRLLALSDANELRLALVPTNINKLILTTTELFKSQAEKKGIAIKYNSKEISAIDADPARLTQILSNLLTNGLRHTPENGEISLILKEIDNAIQLEVKDTGLGFPVDVLPRIFDRFYRADSSRARDQGGSGLGLTIAKRLAEAMGGTLTANNHSEGGAILILNLPLMK